MRRVWKEHTVEPKAGKVKGGIGVLACEEVGVDCAGGKVNGPSKVR
jgi:hypothetical protein